MVSRALLLAAALSAACGGPAKATAPAAPVLAVAVAPAPKPAPPPWDSIARADIVRDVAWLTADERKGRGFDQPGGEAAAAWIEQRFRDAGLEVVRQPIGNGADNVIGILRGGEQAVIVSAHYDHLGVDAAGVVYPGADDNASGVAVMLAILGALHELSAGDTLIFIGFGAEEDGLRGSNVYVHDPVWPLERTRVLVNFDMVGRNLFELIGAGQRDAVGVVGLEAAELHRDVAMRAAEAEGMTLLAGSADLIARFGFDGRTDDWWFRQEGVPTIHFSTGLHRDYHEPTDTADRLKPEQMTHIARLAARIVVELSGRAYDSE